MKSGEQILEDINSVESYFDSEANELLDEAAGTISYLQFLIETIYRARSIKSIRKTIKKDYYNE